MPRSISNGFRTPAGGGGRLRHAWLSLTKHERRAALVVLGLFLLGVATRFWHICLR